MAKNKSIEKFFVIFAVVGGFGIVTGIVIFNSLRFISPKIIPQKPTNILILGVDGEGNYNRSDVLMVVNIKPDLPTVSIISIPRDFRVYLPQKGLDKINHAYIYGGIKLLNKSLENFLGIPINGYAKLDFIGLVNIVDRLGGVIIDVEKRMHYIDRSGNLYIDLYPGLQRLTGAQAIGYIRFRGDSQGDLGRIERQQKFIWALADEIGKISNFTKIPVLIEELGNNVETNIGPLNLIFLVLNIKKAYETGGIKTTTLKGTPIIFNGVFYLEPDLADVNQKIQDLIINQPAEIFSQESK